MGETTAISWADHTFNPWIGCTKVSVGDKGACEGCYAEAQANRYGWAEWGNHPRHRTSLSTWAQPMTWNRKAREAGTRPFVFCASLADVFDNQVPPEWRRELFDVIRETPHLTWLLLTKRPQNIVRLFEEACASPADRGDTSLADHWPRNAAIGCTVVTQAEADRDVPYLLAAKASLAPAFAFLSLEPLMEAVDLTRLSTMRFAGAEVLDGLTGELSGMFGDPCATRLPPVDWIIAGGETDQGKFKARETPDGAFESLMAQCEAAGVPFHMKQMTRKRPIPAHLDRREFPPR